MFGIDPSAVDKKWVTPGSEVCIQNTESRGLVTSVKIAKDKDSGFETVMVDVVLFNTGNKVEVAQRNLTWVSCNGLLEMPPEKVKRFIGISVVCGGLNGEIWCRVVEQFPEISDVEDIILEAYTDYQPKTTSNKEHRAEFEELVTNFKNFIDTMWYKLTEEQEDGSGGRA